MTRNLISDPAVVTAAWQRVQSWYQTNELKPEPEFSSWLLRTEEHLAELSEDLASGSYTPSPFQLIPFPKSGAILRHYSVPSVRDQVAFTCYAILLAPLLEIGMANFSFANRWYRGIYQKSPGNEWHFRSFNLYEKSIFQPNRRSHNLFRRVSHWSAQSMVGKSEIDGLPLPDEPEAFEYPTCMLPPFIKRDWWEKADTDTGYWCQLDLQLAYPSVVIQELKDRLHEMLKKTFPKDDYNTKFTQEFSPADLYSAMEGYPSNLRNPLSFKNEIASELVDELCNLLQKTSYQTELSGDFWKPPHTDQILPTTSSAQEHPGLPTGLLISGLLLNCYLNPLDRTMGQWMLESSSQKPVAFMRYADDLIILSTSQEQLFAGLDKLWNGITSNPDSILGNPSKSNTSNLRVNFSKISPDSMSKVISKYLAKHGITKCPECDHFQRQEEVPTSEESISTWWSNEGNSVENKNLLQRTSIDKDRIGPFVTFLVENLSDIGKDDSLYRFGEPARQRLKTLQSLITEQTTDLQVRSDTRLLFAAHRLAKSWLPDENPKSARQDISQIRTSVYEAIMQAPWKYQLWTAVIRSACRRPPGIFSDTDSAECDESREFAEFESRTFAA